MMSRLGAGLSPYDVTIWTEGTQTSWHETGWTVQTVKGNHIQKISKAINKNNEEVTSFGMFTIPINLDIKENDYRIKLGAYTDVEPHQDAFEPISCDNCTLIRDRKKGKVTSKWLVKV